MPGTNTYKQTHVMTATPIELIIMLYEEGVSALQKAEDAFKLEGPERFQEISNNILHAQDVITELSVSLNEEKGGQIANNLQKLYEFMISHLCNANTRKSSRLVREVRELMTELSDTWKQVAAQSSQSASGVSVSDGVNMQG